MSDFKPDIWRLQAQLDIAGLNTALSNDDPGIRKRAAAALRALGATESITALEQALQQETDSDTRLHITAALEALQAEIQRQKDEMEEDDSSDETAIISGELQRLIHQLQSDDEDEVIQTAKRLGELKDKQAVEPLVVQFKDPKVSVKVRLAVAEALLELESALVEIALLGALRRSDWRIRRNGAAILGQLKADWAIDPLSKALFDKNAKVRRTAFAALKYIGTPEAINAIRAAKAKRDAALVQKESTPVKTDTTEALAVNPEVSINITPDEDSTSTADITPETPANDTEKSAPLPDASGMESNDDDEPDGDKIAWPKRQEVRHTNLAPTKPLNPDVLEEARARFEQMKQEEGDDEA